jgi:hypothetical protein
MIDNTPFSKYHAGFAVLGSHPNVVLLRLPLPLVKMSREVRVEQ